MKNTSPPTTARQQATAPATTMMKAILQTRYGSPDVLRLADVPAPMIGEDEVLIRVRAAGVNHADWVYTSGRPLIARLAFGWRSPKQSIRGKDLAGQVEAVGKNVTQFRLGDHVFAEVEAGAFAEYAIVPATHLALKPANLTFEQAATVPLAARTALQALRDGGELRSGQTVLINGASGGVGTYAVQIAKALGADVTGVSSTRNTELVRSLGAVDVIDYTKEDFTASGRRYDVILDLIGNHSLTQLRRALTRTGTLVLSSGTGSAVFGPMGRIISALALSPFVSQNLRIFSPKLGTEVLDELRHLIESGEVTPAIDRTYKLRDAPEAIRYFAEEHARGKIVISIAEQA
ncbi:NADPH:quinone reductase-like Zn-dependent oxidoreductase [Pseudarthrobacter sp. W1I19]|uniref:NAD(P)-dependent alcohol dehydrogenase n=1 Tax=Pseudarthrobacter sp. W1I19 TaxID=3042288 RepID=UPI002785FF31|nr:NAD(P)-dependent alcohol dehydrogenase [Pseudarthrobacter sp. W1I19]MDQ0923454.1 NADPH:quinone reductase-like Zn-dependent oxidoreductase [Pseudarthrobacter sp. W1I19]